MRGSGWSVRVSTVTQKQFKLSTGQRGCHFKIAQPEAFLTKFSVFLDFLENCSDLL